jgi:hypothetical protein
MLRKREAIAVKDSIATMKKKIEPDSYWFLIAMDWLKAWEKYVFMDEINNPEKEPDPDIVRNHPGPINCESIIDPNLDILTDTDKANNWMNVQVKKGLIKDEHFIIVNIETCTMLSDVYGASTKFPPVERHGINDTPDGGDDFVQYKGEVEIYLR